ncbi:methyltransferase [Streptomyces sp. V3I7]|uniref:methyltransferase n=1 Tax=Streptomyces sp. V3I7 TaxID=3042278 RepID=UPI00278A282F|nr:methyltransferase domain-containing protein [Streptomyces sp. V3I7]MDQ0994380.1 SAM-dependent methyltransferase [Streptomyces sp. V3I7]
MHRTEAAEGHYAFADATAHVGEQYRCLSAAYDARTCARLAESGVGPGWRCLEVGAGGGTVSGWLAERVAPDGHVTATDLDPRHIGEQPCLTVLRHDVVADPLPAAAYDLIVQRLVLQHLPERESVLGKLVQSLKPGGLLLSEEFDASYEPPLLTPDAESERLYRTFFDAKLTALRDAGADPEWGRKSPAALRAAGLVDIDVRMHIESRSAGSPSLLLQRNHSRHLRDRLTAAGMTDAQLEGVRRLMDDPSFLAASSVMYSVRGRRPLQDGTR